MATAATLKCAQLRLARAEDRVQRASLLADKAESDASQKRLLVATCRDLKEIRNGFDEDHLFIAANATEELLPHFDEEIHAERLVTFDNLYYKVLAVCDALQKMPLSSDTDKSDKSPHSQNPRVALPTIKLPVFSGDIRGWQNFSNLFEALVGRQPHLSNVERLSYLKLSLQGEPLSLIQALPLTEDNFEIAWKMLQRRYNNQRLIVNHHLDALANAPSISLTSATYVHLLSSIQENVAALEVLGIPVNTWDPLLIYLLERKLDPTLRREWELTLTDPATLPTLDQFMTFLEGRQRMLEAIGGGQKSKQSPKQNQTSTGRTFGVSSHSTHSFLGSSKGMVHPCILCHQENHLLAQCPQFLQTSHRDRFALVKRRDLCINCLRQFHKAADCFSKSSCRTCGARHHTLLHFEDAVAPAHNLGREENSDMQQTMPQEEVDSEHPPTTSLTSTGVTSVVLLATANVGVRDASGAIQSCRALLDSGSQANFITSSCLQRLGLPRYKCSRAVQGLSGISVPSVKGIVTCHLEPMGEQSLGYTIDTLVLNKISDKLPSTKLSINHWEHLSNLRMADPHFGTPKSIDLLLGAELFPLLLTGDRIEGDPGSPVALKSVFGWLVMGKVQSSQTLTTSLLATSLHASLVPLEDTLQKFWELEEVPTVVPDTAEEKQCEEIFKQTHKRGSDGRYTVTLPFKKNAPELGESRSQALTRLQRLEQKLHRQPDLKILYNDFMKDYITSGHMEKVTSKELGVSSVYYIPHHGVLKPDSTTTKLRVVFDASARTSSGFSLNDIMLSGKKLQCEISDLILRLRLHQIAFTADIQQMYRQVVLDPQQRDYHRILWRFREEDPIQEFRLKTVTYGVSAAPFLAIRTLHQLAEDERKRFPHAADVLVSDTYVDDVVTGAASLQDALQLQQELVAILQSGGFYLRKFVSNSPQFLENLPSSQLQQPIAHIFDSDGHTNLKVLGLQWNPKLDTFSYKVHPTNNQITKRGILSDIARIFDPLGWLSPLLLLAKAMIQELWLEGVDWDTELPEALRKRWIRCKEELVLLEGISIPRGPLVTSPDSVLELHGFSDSSELGYAAVVYLRENSCQGPARIHLLMGRSKVAPTKRVSLPRLELCAAVLLSKTLHYLLRVFSSSLKVNRVLAWTDSTVTLAWIRSSSHKWKSFVANRVGEIQTKTSPEWWHHVPSGENPADCASRGLLPSLLVEHPLWWAGPPWLQKDPTEWPMQNRTPPIVEAELIIEQRSQLSGLFVGTVVNGDLSLLQRFSSLAKIKRITAYCLRFIQAAHSRKEPLHDALQTCELQAALLVWVKRTQAIEFATELSAIGKGECPVPFRRLNPFIDSEGVLRVGGRLQASTLPYGEKHPILLPRKCRLTELIIDQLHQDLLHPGSQHLLSVLQQDFWLVNGRNIVRQRLHWCVICFRCRPNPAIPQMGNLPASRITQAKAFMKTGVDYAGPFSITMIRARKPRIFRAYICLFVCFTTKAIHLELVSDLSTEAFLAAFRRFVARRGCCTHLYSDCGTNFVGADNQLKNVQAFLEDPANNATISSALSDQAIMWHFNPPGAPHFGGLWEAGVKSAKTHLKKVIGNQLLTYEEFYTVLTQVEAVLNSRPLTPLSTDPRDLTALTPSHFLTLGPPQMLPEEDVTAVSLNRLSRWSVLQQAHQCFWRRWHKDYLHQLQVRSKWTKSTANVKPNTLVLIQDPNLPPLRWKLGRVTQRFPGVDGIVRVAELYTSQGLITRPITKLCPLPLE